MAFGTVDIGGHVSTVIEVNKVGKVVNLLPRDRFLGIVRSVDFLNFDIVCFETCQFIVAPVASLRGGNPSMLRPS